MKIEKNCANIYEMGGLSFMHANAYEPNKDEVNMLIASKVSSSFLYSICRNVCRWSISCFDFICCSLFCIFDAIILFIHLIFMGEWRNFI